MALEDQDPVTEETMAVPRDQRNPSDTPPGSIPDMTEAEIAAVEKILGYEFSGNDRKQVVQEALTHVSLYSPYKPGVSYERLEFLGDAVLSCLVAREVFTAYPELPPHPLTLLRAANVDKEKLSRVAAAHGLHLFLRHKAPPLVRQIQDFMDGMLQYPIHSNGLLDPPKILSDIVESLLGAIFMDSKDIEIVWKVFRRLADPLISPETLGKHPMTELFELCQKTRRGVRIMKDHWTKNLTVEVLIDGQLCGSATYGSKKEIAQNRAAKAALDRLKKENLVESS